MVCASCIAARYARARVSHLAPAARAPHPARAFQEGMSHRQAFLLECFLSIFCALVLACCLGLCLEHCRQTRRPKDKRRELQMKIKRLADMHAKSG